jgi:UvrD-like helicase C-terminal domain/AAA domain
MPVTAFEGPAGTGKTFSLMQELCSKLRDRTLASHERALALTFMHGARRRLDHQLRQIEELDGHFQAVTIDSFAWRLVQRWRRLATSLGYAIPPEENYDETCLLAATLMVRPAVRSWIAMSYPLVLVDEAQDLSSERSAMVAAATHSCHVLLAFDEFQCLNPNLRPMAIQSWLADVCTPTTLTECRRTNDAELLEAARVVRNGRAINRDGTRFKVISTPSKPLAATFIANAIAWRGSGTLAVLTPSRSGGFADGIIDLVRSRPLGKQRNGPFPIRWESSDEMDHRELCQNLRIPERCSVPDALTILEAHIGVPAVKTTKEWVERQRRVLGIEEVTADQINRQLGRTLTVRRRFAAARREDLIAMTIQQAKNQQFEHIVVIWPYTIPTDSEQKRRLLYNAITRAQLSCLVLVQAEGLLDMPPFVPQ